MKALRSERRLTRMMNVMCLGLMFTLPLALSESLRAQALSGSASDWEAGGQSSTSASPDYFMVPTPLPGTQSDEWDPSFDPELSPAPWEDPNLQRTPSSSGTFPGSGTSLPTDPIAPFAEGDPQSPLEGER